MLESVVHESRGKASPVLWYCSYSVHDARHAYAMIAAGRYVIPARELKIFQISNKIPVFGPHSALRTQQPTLVFPHIPPFCSELVVTMLLHNGSEEKNQHGHSSSGFLSTPGAGAVAQSSSDDGPREMDDRTAPACEEIEPFNINIPVFMERTFRMIDSVSDDIVCWSRAGDSFIVKKASDTMRWCGDKS